MKLNLNTSVEVEVDDSVILKIEVRKLTKKESKAFQKDITKIIDAGKDIDKLTRKISYLTKKNELEPTMELLDQIYELEETQAEFDGLDINDKIEDLYRKKLMMIVTGDDKKAILDLSTDIGYREMDSKLSEAVTEENKQGK